MVTVEELLEDAAIKAYLLRLIGEEGMLLLERFPSEGEFSDEDLAEKTGINLNSVRHTLYTLYEKRLAEYRRLKNAETGWLTYLWKLTLDRISDAIAEDMQLVLEKLETRKTYEEENVFFTCKACGRFTFNEVVDIGFICPACGKELEHFENETLLAALCRRAEAMRQCLGK
ncbi:MAG: transcription factor [Methanomicrobiales archaeon]|nr:transcription factor [Methanomicrobiales archaeon]